MDKPTLKSLNVNGLTMQVAMQGNGPLVILCRGFPELWISWREQLQALADAGFWAVAPDMRGYRGTTAPENDAAYTLLHLVDDMVELVTQLESSGDRKAVYADGFTRTGFRGGLNWYRNMTRSWS